MKKATHHFSPAPAVLTVTIAAGLAAPLTGRASNLEEVKEGVVANYASIVHASYEDSLQGARSLQKALQALVNKPSAGTLAAARTAWVEARLPYLQTEVFRFYSGPIDAEDGPEGLLNAWPLDEAYVDYVEGAPDAGIINDPERFPKIYKELIEVLNERDGEENISTGYHAIEFLLWGQDRSATGPGNRSHRDYADAPNAGRRGAYLLAAGELLVDKLEDLVIQWAPGRDNYRRDFEYAPPTESIRLILTGMGMLSGFELSGERLLIALETRDQEDEHSCFSDTTHNDVVFNALGLVNVWEGDYVRTGSAGGSALHQGARRASVRPPVRGPGVKDLVAAVDPDLAERLDGVVHAAHNLSREIPVPFDQAILDEVGRAKILKVVEALEAQAELLVAAGGKLAFTVPTTEEE